MKKRTYTLWVSLCLLLCYSMVVIAQDTINIQTFTFDDPAPSNKYKGSFEFPNEDKEFQKITMYYTLKCHASTQADGFPCGEWDYLSYTYIIDSTGTMDSTYKTQPNFTVGGSAQETFNYTTQPTYDFYQNEQEQVVILDTLSFSSATFAATDETTMDIPFNSNTRSGRSQFIWTAEELTNAGLTAGKISGIKLETLANIGSSLKNLTIKCKQTELTELTSDSFEKDDFTTVYEWNTTLLPADWNSFNFTTPFDWDGVANIVVDFTFDNSFLGTPTAIKATTTNANTGVYLGSNEQYLDFKGNGNYVNCGSEVQAKINGTQERTIEAWAYVNSFNDGGIFQAGPTGTVGADFSLRTSGTTDRWRFQMWGTPDTDVTLPNSVGQWHHYCVTYQDGVAKVFFDGVERISRNVTINTGATDLRIGRWANSFFDGNIDEFRVWDKALSRETIANWMNKTVDGTHPNYSRLVAYYPMNEGEGATTYDASPNQHDAQMFGLPAWRQLNASNLVSNLQQTTLRPAIAFEQGDFTTEINTTISIDSLQHAPKQLLLFNNPANGTMIFHGDPNHPTLATDTLYVWASGDVTQIFGENGNLIETIHIPVENTLLGEDKIYYSNVVRYEIARYITPYGIGLDLGPDGFTWQFDVTDYAPLLKNKVYIEAGNNQELLDLRFEMIEGTPTRRVAAIKNLWVGHANYRTKAEIESFLTPRTIDIPDYAEDVRLKVRVTGHGFGDAPHNCAEFCPRVHAFTIDGVQRFSRNVWRDNCGENPVQPQGGTWVYNRANWCPGAEVETYDFEMTPYITPGESLELDYNVLNPQGGHTWNGVGSTPYYAIESQLVIYGERTVDADVAMVDILAPNSNPLHNQLNPMCDNPIIKIQNRSSEPITSVLIKYGFYTYDEPGWIAFPGFYRWEGNLAPMEMATIDLPLFNWSNLNEDNPRFWVELSEPSNGPDEYRANNRMEVAFNVTPQYESGIKLELKTNAAPHENSYTITNSYGEVVYEGSGFSSNTTYIENLILDPGCYEFHLIDTDGDGLNWFAAPGDGTGHVRLRDANNNIIQNFDPDFGAEIKYPFTIGLSMGQLPFDPNLLQADISTGTTPPIEKASNMVVYPNPTTGKVAIALHFAQSEEVKLTIYNTLGQVVHKDVQHDFSKGIIYVDLPTTSGLYYIKASTKQTTITESVVVK